MSEPIDNRLAASSELLSRLSKTLRADIAPEVGVEYARTQAFMASVILERVSKELALGPAHAQAESADMAELQQQLRDVLATGPSSVVTALDSAQRIDELGPLIAELYAWGSDNAAAASALEIIRPALRRDIDRRMEIAT